MIRIKKEAHHFTGAVEKCFLYNREATIFALCYVCDLGSFAKAWQSFKSNYVETL